MSFSSQPNVVLSIVLYHSVGLVVHFQITPFFTSKNTYTKHREWSLVGVGIFFLNPSKKLHECHKHDSKFIKMLRFITISVTMSVMAIRSDQKKGVVNHFYRVISN